MPNKTLQIYLHQKLNNKLNILNNNQLKQLIPKTTKNNISHPIPQLKHTTIHILIKLLIQNPKLTTLIPPLKNLNKNKLPKLNLFKKLINTYLSQPNLTTKQLLKHYHNTNNTTTLKKLSI